jgi:hypothetical protein
LLLGVSSLADPDHTAWPLKMTSTALNLRIGQQLKHQPDMGKPKALILPSRHSGLPTFGVSIAFLIFSRRLIKHGFHLFSS